MALAKEFEAEKGYVCLVPALKFLQKLDLGMEPVLKQFRRTRANPEADNRIIAQFKEAMVASGNAGKTDKQGSNNADKMASTLRSFSAWLKAQGLEGLATRLHDGSLDVDLSLYTHGKSGSRIRTVAGILKRLRSAFPANVPSPFEFPQTPSGWSNFSAANRSAWQQEDAGQEATGLWQAPQNAPSDSYFDSLSSLHPASSYRNPGFAASSPQQEVTGPWRSPASSGTRRPIPTFDERDTGPNWQHGEQYAPQWLLDRGVQDQQIVEIRGVDYRVRQIGAVMAIYPAFRGG
jgi:hypothetical protein